MTSWFQARVNAYLRRAGDTSRPSHYRGKIYENLLTYVIESVPGCYVERNSLNCFGTEEADITVSAERVKGGFESLPELFIVECKNWSSPVDSTTLGYFVNVLADRGCTLGVLAAANGITGNQEHRTRAHAIGQAALVRGIRVLLITSDDLATLRGPADLVALLRRRNVKLTSSGSIFLN